MAHRNRPSFVDIDTSSDEEDGGFGTPTPSPDEDYAPSSNVTTPDSANSNTGMIDDEDMDVIAQNRASMNLDEYGMSYQRTDDGVHVRRSKRARKSVRRMQYSPVSDGDEDGGGGGGDGNPFGSEDANIAGEWLGSDDSDDSDEDEEVFYHKHPEMRGFVVSDSAGESDEEYIESGAMDMDDDDSSSDRSTPKATLSELARLLKSRRCKKSDEDAKCAICVSYFRCRQVYVALPACQHRFHKTCIQPWLLQHNRCCPTCRKDVAATLAK